METLAGALRAFDEARVANKLRAAGWMPADAERFAAEWLLSAAHSWNYFADDIAAALKEADLSRTDTPWHLAQLCDLGGDRHAGRYPVKLQLPSLDMIFKPRRADAEILLAAVQELAGFRAGIRWSCYQPFNLGESSLWSPIKWKTFREAQDCSRFYCACGVLLASAHTLRLSDLNHENLMIHDGMPRVIDAEFIMQPSSRWLRTEHERQVWDSFEETVLATLMLPLPGTANDFSALGNAQASVQPDGGRRASHHRPQLEGRFINAREFLPEIIAGFEAGYRALAAQRRELANEVLAYTGRIRVAVRPTGHYVAIEKWLWSPEVANFPSAIKRRLLQDRLRSTLPGICTLVREWITEAEASALLAADIPIFHARAHERGLWANYASYRANVLDAAPRNTVLAAIERMGESDLNAQTRVIGASLLAATADDFVQSLQAGT